MNLTPSNLPKNVSNHYPELYPPKEKILRIVFGTFFERLQLIKKTLLEPLGYHDFEDIIKKVFHVKVPIL